MRRAVVQAGSILPAVILSPQVTDSLGGIYVLTIYLCFETGSQLVAQAGLELTM